jgi:filamentous hemagglutinin
VTTSGSTLNAGNNLAITATGGDITVAGGQLKAGKDVTLEAFRDVNLTASQDTQQTTGSNKSSGGSIGVGVGWLRRSRYQHLGKRQQQQRA